VSPKNVVVAGRVSSAPLFAARFVWGVAEGVWAPAAAAKKIIVAAKLAMRREVFIRL
jgi:hypothetical protein